MSALAVGHEDDVPVRSILDDLEERLGFGADGEPAVVMAQAVILYWRTVSTRLTTTRTRSCGWP